MSLKAWKFVVPMDCWVKHPSGDQFKGCIAVVLAETQEAAKTHLTVKAAEDGDDARWLDVATVKEIPLTEGARLAWVML